MTRKQALLACRAAGATDDRKTFLRVYTENRISFAAANQAWRDGRRIWEAQRHAKLVNGESLGPATISGAM